MASEPTTITPPALARRYGIGVTKVLAWIARNELRAINVASRRGMRPRWVIPISAIEQFEARRSNDANTAPTPRRRRRTGIRPSPAGVEFF
jgi:hypothetical protein